VTLVVLASGGLDSTLLIALAIEERREIAPLFIDYGQLAREAEWDACQRALRALGAPDPTYMDLSGYGQVIPSGLTRPGLRRNEDAFLPGRNLLFAVAGASYAMSIEASSIALGLLSEKNRIYPDQTAAFLSIAEDAIGEALGARIRVLAPLMDLTKAAVVRIAKSKGILGTYSCHSGESSPCGTCISCLEFVGTEE
jgi:7-cyano-7-deazaguanine synthase